MSDTESPTPLTDWELAVRNAIRFDMDTDGKEECAAIGELIWNVLFWRDAAITAHKQMQCALSGCAVCEYERNSMLGPDDFRA